MIRFITIVSIIFLSLKVAAQNPPCSNTDFETFNAGPLPLSAIAWTVGEANNGSNSIMCPTAAVIFSVPVVNNNAFVVQTPLSDPIINNIPNSPLGGNKVLVLNRNFVSSVRASSVKNNFLVSASAPIYKYAFITALQAGEPCCQGVLTIFRFYDCSGNMISALSKTYTANSSTCISTAPQPCVFSPGIQWNTVPTSPVTFFNTGWTVDVANLSAYVGSCVTVEVISSNCTGAAHQGYLYYDASCSADVLFPAANPAVNNYTSCTGGALLTGPPCFNSYLWQGPSTSSVNGLTTQSVNTAVSGIYTLTVTQGTITLSQTLALSISPTVPSVSITASSLAGCPGSSFQLLATGSSANSYSWSTGATASTISIKPASTSIYWVTTTDPLGCTATDIKTITIHPQPFVQILSSPPACPGNSVLLSTSPPAWSSYTWSSGSNTGTTTVTPLANTLYSLSVTNANGCTASSTKSIAVLPVFPVYISPLTPTVCPYQPITLIASGQGAVSYMWNTGVKTHFLFLTPTVTAIYSVTATDNQGCLITSTAQVTVDECISVKEEQVLNRSLMISPNPAHDQVEIKGNELMECTIITMQGSYLTNFELKKENNFTFFLKNPGEGVYYLVSGKLRRTIVFK